MLIILYDKNEIKKAVGRYHTATACLIIAYFCLIKTEKKKSAIEFNLALFLRST